MAALPLLLFCFGALFFSANADQYKHLDEIEKKMVDLIRNKVNSSDHLFFYNLHQGKSYNRQLGFKMGNVTWNFKFKATNCSSLAVDTTWCEVRRDRPELDCHTCYKQLGRDISPIPIPYSHCEDSDTVELKRIEIEKMRRENCDRVFASSVVPTLLASTGTK